MVRVTLDIFSGRPNPTWNLDESTAREVLREITAQPELLGGVNSTSGKLGFRGLLVEVGDLSQELPAIFRVNGDDHRGVELADRLLARLGAPLPEQAAPAFGLTPASGIDFRRLVNESAQQGSGGAFTASADEFAQAQVIQALNPAPVLGTDASSWSTIAQGSCTIEVATFNPTFWNNAAYQTKNNCYNYASNRRTDTFAQPGRAAGAMASRMRCANVSAAAQADGCVPAPTCVASTNAPRWYTAMVVWPNLDYHWYRKSAEGFWGHKPGQTPAKNTDDSGVVITNPETANRGGYRDFCGYFTLGTQQGIA